MDSSNENEDDTAQGGGWSLLYAPSTPLQPTSCAECGNVFAAESAECPWCGRPVGALRAGRHQELELGSSAALLIPPSPDPVDTDVSAIPGDWLESTPGQHARRWAGVIVAAGVLLAIATGVTFRARDDGRTTAAVGPTSSAARTTTSAASAPTTASATPVATTASATSAVPVAPVTTAPATTAATTIAPAAPTSTVARTTVAPTTTTDAGPSLSAQEQRAVAVTRDLNDAIVRKDWNRVRALVPKNAVSDDTYQQFWGAIEAATVVPARVTAVPGGTYDVYVGVVSVSRTNGSVTSTVVCGRYGVDLATDTVGAVTTKQLRTEAGLLDSAVVAAELRDTCRDPGL